MWRSRGFETREKRNCRTVWGLCEGREGSEEEELGSKMVVLVRIAHKGLWVHAMFSMERDVSIVFTSHLKLLTAECLGVDFSAVCEVPEAAVGGTASWSGRRR